VPDSSLIPHPPPSEYDSARQKAELEALVKELAEKESELATLQNQLSAFERRYARIIGVLLAELDALEREIARELYRLHPDEEHKNRFRRAERRAKRTKEAVDDRIGEGEETPFRPTPDLKRLFRKVARAVHPDLATDERERAYRTSLMARANEAYKNGDMEALRQILKEWEARDESAFAAEPERSQLGQKIAQIRARIAEIDRQIAKLKGSELCELMIMVEQAELAGRDLLKEMAERLRYEIESARMLLESLRHQ
jgi:uncharacterized protein YhaN